jgi:hypothetical protein
VSVKPGTQYVFSTKILNSSPGTVSVVFLDFYDASGAFDGAQSSFDVSTAGVWTEGRQVITAPADASTALITLQRNAQAGDVRFDDVVLDVAPPDSSRGLLQNATFDNSVGIWGNSCNEWSPLDANGSITSGSLLSSYGVNDPCSSYAVANQQVAVTPNTTYSLSATVLNSAPGIVTAVLLNFYDSSGADAGGAAYFYVSTVGTWTKGRLTATAPSNAATALVTVQRNDAAGEVRFDDIVLEVPPPPMSSGLLQNGTFDRNAGIWGNPCNSWSAVDADGSFSSGSLLSSFGTNDICAGYAVANQTVDVQPGQSYILTTKALNGSAGIVTFILINFYDALGVDVGGQSFASVASPGLWTSTSQAVTAPANAKIALVTLQRNGATPGEVRFDDILLVSAGQRPVIESLSVSPSTITSGSTTTLSWSATGGTYATIDNSISGVVPASGSVKIRPAQTTTYTLTVRSQAGVDTRTATVVVNNAAPSIVSTLSGSGAPGVTDGASSISRFARPFAISAMPRSSSGKEAGATAVASSDMLVLDSNHTIRRISPDGTTVTWAGRAGVKGNANGHRTAATFDFSDYAGAIVANSDGTVDVIDANGLPRHIDAAGNVTNPCASCARFPRPAGMVRLADKTIYISDAATNTITRISPTGLTTVIGKSGQPGMRDGSPDQARFDRPRGLAVDSTGTVYVLDTGNNAIRRIDSNNVVSTMSAPRGESGGGDLVLGCCANGIVTAPGGGVYITDPGSNTIKQVGADGSISTVAGSGTTGGNNGGGSSASFNNPLGMTSLPDGTLIVTDTTNNTVRSVRPSQTPSKKRAVRH